jgi:group II intron reverse transcriptase/maturase
VDIPKASGGTRPLGIPTVGDRIAQMVAKMVLEPDVEPIFHPYSYGYRPGRSAKDALNACRQNCWRFDWVIDLDIKGFFDAIDHTLLMKAVHKHATEPWLALYIERWLKAPVAFPDGRIEKRTHGTPQGGVISPLLANLFLHYVFDRWMHENWRQIPFERYADDCVCHCRTKVEAETLLEDLKARFSACGLTLHPDKTKLVYCKERGRGEEWDTTQFTFLGFQFRCRTTCTRRGDRFQGFNPGMDPAAAKRIRQVVRERLSSKSCMRSLRTLVGELNPMIRGWLEYYGHFRPSEFQRLVGGFIDRRLMHWARRKYKRMRKSWKKAGRWVLRLRRREPDLLAHWQSIARMGGAV